MGMYGILFNTLFLLTWCFPYSICGMEDIGKEKGPAGNRRLNSLTDITVSAEDTAKWIKLGQQYEDLNRNYGYNNKKYYKHLSHLYRKSDDVEDSEEFSTNGFWLDTAIVETALYDGSCCGKNKESLKTALKTYKVNTKKILESVAGSEIITDDGSPKDQDKQKVKAVRRALLQLLAHEASQGSGADDCVRTLAMTRYGLPVGCFGYATWLFVQAASQAFCAVPAILAVAAGTTSCIQCCMMNQPCGLEWSCCSDRQTCCCAWYKQTSTVQALLERTSKKIEHLD